MTLVSHLLFLLSLPPSYPSCSTDKVPLLCLVGRGISCDPACHFCCAIIIGFCLHGAIVGTQDAWLDLTGSGSADVQARCLANLIGFMMFTTCDCNDLCSPWCCQSVICCVPHCIYLVNDCAGYGLTVCLYHACFRTKDGYGMLEARPLLEEVMN